MPSIGSAEKSLVAGVIESGFLNDGDVTTEFESEIARILGCRYAVATTSGTSALYLALAAAGIGPGDEVIVPDMTFIATANAVTLTGARPVLVDIDATSLTLDPDCAERAITQRTRAIIPVHVSGRAANMSRILDVAGRHGLQVIEDAAEAFLSQHQGKSLGTLGLAGCFSLSPNKTITTGQGGLVVTNDGRLHARVRELKDQGRSSRGTGGDDLHNTIGFNFKFTNVQAAIGLGQLQQLRHRVERMKAIHRAYRAELQGVAGISLLSFCLDAGEVPQWTDVLLDRRDELYGALAASGIRGRRFWHPIHTQLPYRLLDDRFPHSTRQAQRAMWLPSCFSLSDSDIEMVSGAIRQFFCP